MQNIIVPSLINKYIITILNFWDKVWMFILLRSIGQLLSSWVLSAQCFETLECRATPFFFLSCQNMVTFTLDEGEGRRLHRRNVVQIREQLFDQSKQYKYLIYIKLPSKIKNKLKVYLWKNGEYCKFDQNLKSIFFYSISNL